MPPTGERVKSGIGDSNPSTRGGNPAHYPYANPA